MFYDRALEARLNGDERDLYRLERVRLLGRLCYSLLALTLSYTYKYSAKRLGWPRDRSHQGDASAARDEADRMRTSTNKH